MAKACKASSRSKPIATSVEIASSGGGRETLKGGAVAANRFCQHQLHKHVSCTTNFMNDCKLKGPIQVSRLHLILYKNPLPLPTCQINSLHTAKGRPKGPLCVDSRSVLVVDGDVDRPDIKGANNRPAADAKTSGIYRYK